MTEDEQRDLALFRYGTISGVISNIDVGKTKEAKFRELSQKTYKLPGSEKQVRFSKETFKKWYLSYKNGGYYALFPKQRIDLGKSRALTQEQEKRILELREKFPKISGQSIYDTMLKEGSLQSIDCSVDTVQRFIRANVAMSDDAGKDEFLAFEFEHVNDCWQGDTMEGPTLTVKGKKVKTYCITFLDDHSRMVVASKHYFNDNALNVQSTFRDAIRLYGIPKVLTLDNGSPYRDKQFMEICAKLGIQSIHLRPYSPEGKGKIERAQGVLQGQYYNTHDFKGYTLEQLNEEYHEYVFTEYNQHKHRMTGEKPQLRFNAKEEAQFIRRKDKEILDFIFLHKEKRQLARDSCISINKTRYEVPLEYIRGMSGKTVWFRYRPEDYSELYLVDEKKYEILYTLKPVDLHANSQRMRKKKGSTVDYTATV